MAARMNFTRNVLLGTTALVALAGCSSNDNPGIAASAEVLGVFGIVVGEPVAVISATRGRGATVDNDKFTVTFNNAEGTSITIGTPEGEAITFNADDPATWIGEDGNLGMELARLVSADGDRLEVMIGEVQVPVAPEPDAENGGAVALNVEYDTEDQLAFAMARLDENDTRDGFETYAVVGQLTDVDDLPRYSGLDEEIEIIDDEEVCVARCGGDLIVGTGDYDGEFLASVFKNGLIVSDAVTGNAYVDIDFGEGEVEIDLIGGYHYDDIDDQAQSAITGFTLSTAVIDGFTYVTGIDEIFYGNANEPGQQVVTDITFNPVPIPLTDLVLTDNLDFDTASLVDNDTFVTEITLDTAVFNGITVVTGVNTISREFDNDDFLEVDLEGFGDGDDIDFNNGVTYTGDVWGEVEVPTDDLMAVSSADVTGEFGGAIFGPGESAFDVLDDAMPYPDDIVPATGTAGVFEANNNDDLGGDPLDDNAEVEIVGAYGTVGDDFCEGCTLNGE